MVTIELKDCNNITSASIKLRKNNLNILYAMNGTGKSTIASAVDHLSKGEDLSLLTPFGSDSKPQCTLSEPARVSVFNENFVNEMVFQQSEVIQNSFEVFIKTQEYDKKQKSIDKSLKKIHVDVANDEELQNIVTVGKIVLSKFTLTASGDFKRQGVMKSLADSESIYHLPEQLKRFKPLMSKKYTVEWVGWKNEGSAYDENEICPFCSSDLDDGYENQKKYLLRPTRNPTSRTLSKCFLILTKSKTSWIPKNRKNSMNALNRRRTKQNYNSGLNASMTN